MNAIFTHPFSRFTIKFTAISFASNLLSFLAYLAVLDEAYSLFVFLYFGLFSAANILIFCINGLFSLGDQRRFIASAMVLLLQFLNALVAILYLYFLIPF